MNYHLYYFSSTGNTARAVGIISEELKARGHSVQLVRINRYAKPLDTLPDRLLIAFPTFAWIPPVMVQRFVRRLPKGTGNGGSMVRAAVFTADGGGCLQAPDQLRRMLRRRGYEVFLTGRASFPDNWQQFIPGPDDKAKALQIARGEEMTREFSRKLLEEQEERYRVASGHQLWSRLVGSLFSFFGRRFMGKMFIADSDCNACGLCAQSCPTGTILLAPGKKSRPFWMMNCESCNRCINVCPQKAIVCSYGRIVTLIAAIVLLASALLGLYGGYLKPLLVKALPGSLFGFVNFMLVTVLVTSAHFLAIGLPDRYLLRFLQRLPGLDRLFARGFNKKYRRYLMPGFKPPLEKP